MLSTDIYINNKKLFFSIVLRNDGRISPKTINECYFNKNNYSTVWNYFISITSNLTSLTIGERVWCFQNDILTLPKCKCCDNLVMISYEKEKHLSLYCSAKCAQSDKDLRKLAASKRDNNIANEKRKITMQQKYGVEYNLQRPDVKTKLKQPKISDNTFQYLNNKEWLIDQYINQNKTSTEIAEYLQCFYGTVLSYLRKHDIAISYYTNTSSVERNIREFLESNDIKYIGNDRNVISKEIDIFIPQNNFAIEINGAYWHSYDRKETTKQINRHKNKFKECADNNITLYQFTDIEYNNKKELVHSMIMNKLGYSIKLDARKCNIVYLDNNTYKDFCNYNHISGYARASVRIGLEYDNKVVSVLSLNKSRFHKNIDWEIIRFSTLLNYTVRGGFSKLLSYFIKTYKTKSICTYSDNRFGFGSVYENNGFEYKYTTEPGYSWTDTKTMFSRYQCQKSKLSLILGDKFDPSLTESDNMFNNKFRRIWDSGHKFFVYK